MSAPNSSPIFALTPYCPPVAVTGTTTDRTGATATNLLTLYTGGTNGSKITQIICKIAGTSVASSVLIFITDKNGANLSLFDEIAVSAITASNTVASFRAVNVYTDLELQSGQIIKVGVTALSANAIIWCQAGDF